MKRFAALAFLLVLASCDSSSAPTPPPTSTIERVRLQLNWVPEPEFGGIYAAEREGFFKAEGLDVELRKGGPNIAAPQLIASGKVEFGVVAGEQVLTLRDAGGELVAVFATYQSDPLGIMVHESSPYRTIDELWNSNATVACETNLSLIAMLNQRFGGRNLKFIPYGGSAVQFAADPAMAQQCFLTAEPVALELKGVKTRVFPSSTSGFDPYNAVVATSATYAGSHPETINKLVRALTRGWRSYLDNPGPTNELMASLNPSMTKEAMDLAARKQARLIESDDTKYRGLGAMTEQRWTTLAQQLKDLGKIKDVPRTESVFRWAPQSGSAQR